MVDSLHEQISGLQRSHIMSRE